MNVAILILPNVLKSAAYGIHELFSINNMYCKSKQEEHIRTTFISLNSIEHFDCMPLNFSSVFDVVMIPPTLKDHSYNVPNEIINWLKYQYNHGAILAAACIGCFILAQTNLLNGKKATTHWAYEDMFKKEFPTIQVDINKILIDEGDIITAGGVNAYMDLCLYIIEKRHSNRTATQLANLMLIDRGRVSQRSYKTFSTVFLYDDSDIKRVVEWMKEHLGESISIQDMANQLKLTEKTFTRRFKKALNISPLHYLINLRIEKAKELLISTNKSFNDIVSEVGYLDENSFRKLFKKETSLNPKEYRMKFQQSISVHVCPARYA